MDKKQFSALKKSIQKIRQSVVEMKGPLEGISVLKKTKKTSKRDDAVISVANTLEKE